MDSRVIIRAGDILTSINGGEDYEVMSVPKDKENGIYDLREVGTMHYTGFGHTMLCKLFTFMPIGFRDIEQINIKEAFYPNEDYKYFITVQIKGYEANKYLNTNLTLEDTAESKSHFGWFKTKGEALKIIEKFLKRYNINYKLEEVKYA